MRIAAVGIFAVVYMLAQQELQHRLAALASLLAPYGNPEALEIARDLDRKVKGLLQEAS
jgi:hypothetical protein